MARPWRRSVRPDRLRAGDGSASVVRRGREAAPSAGGEATIGPGVTTATMASALAPFGALDECRRRRRVQIGADEEGV